MIQSWANSRSRRFYEQGKASKFSGLYVEAAEDLLAALDAAESLSDLSPLRSLGLHKLKGDRAGQWARINAEIETQSQVQIRACFFSHPGRAVE